MSRRLDDREPPTHRARVPSSSSAVNFAPPPIAGRRPSWIGATPVAGGSTSGMGFDGTGRRPSWTPAPLEAGTPTAASLHAIKSGKRRLFYPAHPEPEEDEPESAGSNGTGSGSGSDDNANWNRNGAGSGSGEGEGAGGESGRGEGAGTGESSEEASNFRVGMQIDMKTLVGDAVGNMSISPTSRDIVLAARRGLFIIDLESPLSVPRFLPQGGTWDVADVQWNPHKSRAEYVVSTSSEKLLIWNLLLPSPSYPFPTAAPSLNNANKTAAPSASSASAPSSIAHVLHAHYRAITDINWHPAEGERDVVASTGIDSWIWAWDLRAAAGGRAVFGLSAFNAGGTQVKWNRQDPHLLASSHAGEVLIWDRRKGSLPRTRLRAHRSKIYGIDWSPSMRDELVTCALDGEIKVWDVGATAGGALYGVRSISLVLDVLRPFFPSSPSCRIGLPTDTSRRVWAPAPALGAARTARQTTTCTHRITIAANFSPSLLRYNTYGHGHYAGQHAPTHTPAHTIRTAHPVWRARHLPFGRGVLSLPQRGGTGLGMYAFGMTPARMRAGSGASQQRTQARKRRRNEDSDDSDSEDEARRRQWVGGEEAGVGEEDAGWGGDEPVEVFEGHTDVVKEFVWRRGGDGTAFQLITWSKDRTLRFWPKVGYVRPPEPLAGATLPGSTPTPATTMLVNVLSGAAPDTEKKEKEKASPPAPTFSFRNPPPPETLDQSILNGNALGLTSPHVPALSAPIGARSILAGVRAGAPVGNTKQTHTQALDARRDARPPPGPLLSAAVGSIRMSRGTAGGRRVGMDALNALTWLSSVKEVAGGGGGERSSSGGRGGGSSGGVSDFERGDSVVGLARKRSDSRGRGLFEEGQGQSLQDELTSVINKLVSAKIKLEKHDLTKKRTCTLGLHGPWGESSSVFIRITFTFPKDYPHGTHPRGTPTVELERNPLISLKNRAFILRRLRALRERQRPCLEACLRFLSEGEKAGAPHPMDSGSSDEGEDKDTRKSRDLTVALLRSHKNLAEPRTSQGTFGPNGELVCFFRAPPRIVRHVLRDASISASPAKTVSDIPTTAHDSVDLSAEQAAPRVFRSPALIADAVRRLSLAATDRVVKPLDPRRPQDGDHILRIMTNLLTFSHDTSQHHRDSESSRQRGDEGLRSSSFAYPAPRRSTVFITNTTHISGGDRKVATGYVFEAETLALLCQKNAEVARDHGRYDHERIFKILQALFPSYGDSCSAARGSNSLVVKMVSRIHSELCRLKDLQMLSMMSMIVLQGCRTTRPTTTTKSPELRGTPTPKYAAMDYFSISRSSSGGNTGRVSPVSPTWPRLTASPPVSSGQAPLSTSNSSRGSWSSLFNAGSVRQFMSGMQDSLKDGLTTPSEPPATSTIPVPKVDRISRGPDSPLPRRRAYWRDSGLPSPSSVSKSWNEATSPAVKHAVSFSSAGHRRPVVSRTNTRKDAIHEARVVLLDLPAGDKSDAFPAEKITEFMNHVYIYADVLFSWQLFHKRLELLKSVNYTDTAANGEQHGIGMIRTCTTCGEMVEQGKNACRNCARPCGMPHCTVCRLPVKGLSRSCLRCFHVTHISCWRHLDVPICPSGCGCLCDNRGFAHGAPFASLPPSSTPITPPRPFKDPT
ncbi:WD-REPEATS-REGION domain-containing protein [Mycena venus]|uniref:WD-REPEATS-REGION domain-containing protein n=1 Tax=Mycena venus TaxID=2733690 RepID=A0A8H6Y7V7_9AGAR|nr:WD-REPEATS-REGION domain-containing protein [Mycena venus]